MWPWHVPQGNIKATLCVFTITIKDHVCTRMVTFHQHFFLKKLINEHKKNYPTSNAHVKLFLYKDFFHDWVSGDHDLECLNHHVVSFTHPSHKISIITCVSFLNLLHNITKNETHVFNHTPNYFKR